VNNAGITRRWADDGDEAGRLGRCAGDEPDRSVPANAGVLRPMLKNRWGRIVNISSVVDARARGQVNYAASKAGLNRSDTVAGARGGTRGITVDAVAPGYIETPMTAVLDEKQRTAMMAAIPLGRAGTDAEICAVGCVSSLDRAGYITGPRAGCNGGMFMGG